MKILDIGRINSLLPQATTWLSTALLTIDRFVNYFATEIIGVAPF